MFQPINIGISTLESRSAFPKLASTRGALLVCLILFSARSCWQRPSKCEKLDRKVGRMAESSACWHWSRGTFAASLAWI